MNYFTPVQINQLPPANSVSSGDYVAVDQSNGNGTYTTRKATLSQITAILASPPIGYVTMVQLKLAMVTQANILTVANAVPAAVENPINIYWNSNAFTQVGDTMSSFIQSTLSYTNTQMMALYALASSEPQ